MERGTSAEDVSQKRLESPLLPESENLGAAPNFNRCFTLAYPSEYFKWIASDDLITNDFLERCIRR